MTKSISLLSDLKNAASRLDEALKEEKTDLIRDATIQRFEFTFELTWKAIKLVIDQKNIQFIGIKSLIREAGKAGLIDEVELWFDFLRNRNLATHTYDIQMAEKVYQSAKRFHEELQNLIPRIESAL